MNETDTSLIGALRASAWPEAMTAQRMRLATDTEMSAIRRELIDFCDAHRLPHKDADELLYQPLSPAQRQWLYDYISRFVTAAFVCLPYGSQR